MTDQIRFDDGAAYEEYMGRWSRAAGDTFLPWLAPAPAQRWVEVGCGNGAFSELIIERCAPAKLHGVDPSDAQVRFAQQRLAARLEQWHLPADLARVQLGDAMALPYDDHTFDVAVMALVLFFVPEPARGVAEMRRVVRPGGLVASYAWDVLGGGFPADALFQEIRAIGLTPLLPPSVSAAGLDESRALWQQAGLEDIETRTITVERTFADFEACWESWMQAPLIGPKVAAMEPAQAAAFKAGVRARVAGDKPGPLTCTARANAIRGRVPV